MHQLPSFASLSEHTARLGLPALVGVAMLPSQGPLERYQLGFAGSQTDLVLSLLRCDPGYDPLHNAFAALTALAAEDVPIPRGMQILPEGSLDRPAALTPAPVGVSARVVVGRDPTGLPLVLRHLGRIVDELSQVYQVHAGTRGDAGRFAPLRASWRDEWRGVAEGQLLLARRDGLGEAADPLWAAIEPELSGLPEQVTSTIVHFGLRPASLWLSDGQVSRIGDWGEAMAADPLAAWAPLLTRLGSTELTTVFSGYGAERIEALLEPDTLARVEVYARTRALWQLRAVAQQARMEPGPASARAVGRALTEAEQWSTDGVARARIRAALDGVASKAPPADPPATGLERQVLLGFAAGPVPPSDRGPHLLGALTSAALIRESDGATAAHFAKVASQFLKAANLPAGRIATLPIPDRDAWRAGLISRAGAVSAGPAVALALLANGLDVVDRLRNHTSSASLRGLEALFLAVLAREDAIRSGSGLEARQRVTHGLIGQDAAIRLGLNEVAAAYADQVLDGLDVLQVARRPSREGDSKPQMEELLPLLTRPIVYAGPAMLLLPTAAAVLRLGRDRLPDQPVSLLTACFG